MTVQERESVMALIVALEAMLEAHDALMPGLRHISVADYMLINDAPLQAKQAIANMRKRLA